MNWAKLLSPKRIGTSKVRKSETRSEWQRDFDRILFSSAFRRLQDKAQVFPFSESDYPRTRLTHSLESSSVGRSLGIEVGRKIIQKHGIKNLSHFDFGAIVAAASLAHDIGNPPFGHSGEDAIQDWFRKNQDPYLKNLTPSEKNDFLNFEGNAQGFRILTRLQKPTQERGLELTFSTLGAFTKYPRESFNRKKKILRGSSSKKHGFFQDDKNTFLTLASNFKLIPKNISSAWFRHPLAFLVEAADDICYRIIDLEDGFLLSKVTLKQVLKWLLPIAGKDLDEGFLNSKKILGQEKVEYLRSKVINFLISETAKCFLAQEDNILKGKFDEPLISKIGQAEHLENLYKFNTKKIYKSDEVVSIELSGYEVIEKLLGVFVPCVLDLQINGKKAWTKSKKVGEFISSFSDEKNIYPNDHYHSLLKVTDFISGMTDTFAVLIYKKITGISLSK